MPSDLIPFANAVAEDMKDPEFAREIFLRERAERRGSIQMALRSTVELMDLDWVASEVGVSVERIDSFLNGDDLDDDELASCLKVLGLRGISDKQLAEFNHLSPEDRKKIKDTIVLVPHYQAPYPPLMPYVSAKPSMPAYKPAKSPLPPQKVAASSGSSGWESNVQG